MCMKKESKKDVYASFGIDYSAAGILTPYGVRIPELLTVGTNSKVGAAATWSILPGTGAIDRKSCGPKTAAVLDAAGVGVVYGTCHCDCVGCYAKAGRYNMDNVKAALTVRTILVYKDLDFFTRAIIAQVTADGIKQVRIHAAGDFFSADYARAWKRIAAICKDVVFWTYTKIDYALDIFRGLDNLFITPSNTPAGVNYGTCADLLRMHKALTRAGYRVHICACGTPYEKHCADCTTGCKSIGAGADYVLFIMHSVKGYTAGKNDPAEYAAVLDIIANQDN